MLAPMKSQAEPGLRFELVRESADADAVRYGLQLDHDQQRFSGRASITLDSAAIRFEWSDNAPPDWCVAAVRAQLRVLVRDRVNTPFPRRVTRWRAAPRARE